MRKTEVLLIILIFILIGCTSKSYIVKYQSDRKLNNPITSKTQIKVALNKEIIESKSYNIASLNNTIYRDLVKNVFTNPINYHDMQQGITANLMVNSLSATSKSGGLSTIMAVGGGLITLGSIFTIPEKEDITSGHFRKQPTIFNYVGATSGISLLLLSLLVRDNAIVGMADITLNLSNHNINKTYNKKSEIKTKINSLKNPQYISEIALQQAMENIKSEIEKDANLLNITEKKPIITPSEKISAIPPKEELNQSMLPPKLIFDYSLVDENNDRILDGGEKITLKVVVKNLQGGIAEGVKVLLSGTSKAIGYLGNEQALGNIPDQGEKEAIFNAILPYQVEIDEGDIIIKVTEARGFGPLETKRLIVAMQPVKEKITTDVISQLIDVDQPLPSSSFKRDDAYAVIIGITDYRSEKIPKATFAKRDAEIIKDYLVNICGISEDNIMMLLNDKAAKSDIEAYLEEWLARNVRKNSFVFVYFAGHGTPNPEKGDAYLVPYDGEPGFISKLYPLSRFYNALENLPSDNIVVALDACFSGAGGRSVIEPGKRPLVPVKQEKTKKTAVITASASDEISQDLDSKKHGLFTYYFLKGLRGEADIDKDGWVTFGELYTYLQPKVTDESRRLGYTQTPQVMPLPLGDKGNLKIGKIK